MVIFKAQSPNSSEYNPVEIVIVFINGNGFRNVRGFFLVSIDERLKPQYHFMAFKLYMSIQAGNPNRNIITVYTHITHTQTHAYNHVSKS